MWFCEELDEYLASIGHVNSFRQKIYPAMKNILTQTCLAAQENAEPRRRRYLNFFFIVQGLLYTLGCDHLVHDFDIEKEGDNFAARGREVIFGMLYIVTVRTYIATVKYISATHCNFEQL